MSASEAFICRSCGEEPILLYGIGLCASCELRERRANKPKVP